jgi:heavy metal sensor kinase
MRLTLWYLASFAVVLLAFAAGTFYAMRASIVDEFDRELTLRIAAIESFLGRKSGADLQKTQHELREHGELRPGGELLQIGDGHGRWIFQSESMRHLGIEMPMLSRSGIAKFATVYRKDIPVRVATASYVSGSHYFVIQLALPLEESSALIQHFGWILIAAIPIVLLVAAVTGYWMAGRALHPVTSITEDARAISALDISKRIAVPLADDELRKLSTTLNEMMDRLEAAFRKITQFTADASHELRTPIAVIRTTAELALADNSSQTPAIALASILEESERTTRLLEDLLVLARSDCNARLRLEDVDLSAPFREAALQTELLASEKNLSVRTRQPGMPCRVHGNADLLRRLFLILADNAVQYTPRGGEITLSLHAEKERFLVRVKDTGSGIAPEDLPHIFERFYRADKARQRSGGAGLGLSIAEWIARVHHAGIDVASTLDAGTTFTLSFPVAGPLDPITSCQGGAYSDG